MLLVRISKSNILPVTVPREGEQYDYLIFIGQRAYEE